MTDVSNAGNCSQAWLFFYLAFDFIYQAWMHEVLKCSVSSSDCLLLSCVLWKSKVHCSLNGLPLVLAGGCSQDWFDKVWSLISSISIEWCEYSIDLFFFSIVMFLFKSPKFHILIGLILIFLVVFLLILYYAKKCSILFLGFGPPLVLFQGSCVSYVMFCICWTPNFVTSK